MAMPTTTQSTAELSVASSPNEASNFRQKTWAYQEDFIQKIQFYQNVSNDPSITALDLRKQHTWGEVIEKARQAEKRYLTAGQTGMRKQMRTFSGYAQAADPFIKLIPNDNGWNVLAGGLKLVFDAADRIKRHREEILKELVRIPHVVLHAEECCSIYGHDAELYAFAERLFVAALSAIELIVQWLERKSINKQVRALLSGEMYSQAFSDKISELGDALAALETKARRIEAATVQSTSREVRMMQSQVDKMSRMQQDNKQTLEDNKQTLEDSRKTLKRMMEILADQKKHAKWMERKEKDIMRNTNRIQDLELANNAMTLAEFVELLDVEDEHPLDDILPMSHSEFLAEMGNLSGALGILEVEAFKHWHLESNSMAFFVEGATATLDSRRASPLSIVCHQLISLHEMSADAAVLYFFCGQHISPTDSLAGPAGMLRSLIRQILRVYPNLKLNFISPKLRSQLLSAKSDVQPLSTCFRHLLRQIPASDTVFCVIDGICFFEKKRWSEACRKAVYELFEVTQDERTYQATIKVFVTSPCRSRYIGKIFPADCCLNVDVAHERSQPTEREIALANAKFARTSMRESLRRSSYTNRIIPQETDYASTVDDTSEDSTA